MTLDVSAISGPKWGTPVCHRRPSDRRLDQKSCFSAPQERLVCLERGAGQVDMVVNETRMSGCSLRLLKINQTRSL
jgi:hypothetical protein